MRRRAIPHRLQSAWLEQSHLGGPQPCQLGNAGLESLIKICVTQGGCEDDNVRPPHQSVGPSETWSTVLQQNDREAKIDG